MRVSSLTKRQRVERAFLVLTILHHLGITLEYTNDDDGIHLSVDGVEVFKGFLYDAGVVHEAAMKVGGIEL